MHTHLVQFFGLLAAASTISWTLPQLVKSLRTRSTAGVSLDAQVLVWCGQVGWVAYAIWTRDIALLIAAPFSVVSMSVVVAILLQAHRRDPVYALGRVSAMVVVVGLAMALGAWWLGPTGLGLVISVVVVLPGIPQVLVAWRATSLHGLAVGMWLLAASCDAVWLVYGVLVGRPVLGAPLAASLPSAALILWAALRLRARDPGPLIEIPSPDAAEPFLGTITR